MLTIKSKCLMANAVFLGSLKLPGFKVHNSQIKLFSIALYCFIGTFYISF